MKEESGNCKWKKVGSDKPEGKSLEKNGKVSFCFYMHMILFILLFSQIACLQQIYVLAFSFCLRIHGFIKYRRL